MLRALMQKVDDVPEQTDDVSRQKFRERREIKVRDQEYQNKNEDAFDWLISELGTTQERISELRKFITSTSKIKNQRNKRMEKQRQRNLSNCEPTTIGVTYV